MYSLSKNTVTFMKGTKPASLKNSQRDAKSMYDVLCQNDYSRVMILDRTKLLKEMGTSEAELYQKQPLVKHVCETALRAYSAVGDGLRKVSRMYSMDLVIPVEDLGLYPDLPKDLIEKVREAGLTELKFSARES